MRKSIKLSAYVVVALMLGSLSVWPQAKSPAKEKTPGKTTAKAADKQVTLTLVRWPYT